MPAGSIGALNSWGVYLLASAALLLVLSPPLASAFQYSREGSDLRSVDGVRAVLSSLQEGVSVQFSFGESTWPDPVAIGGHTVACSYGGGEVSAHTPVLLSNATLRPDVVYTASMIGGEIEVSEAV